MRVQKLSLIIIIILLGLAFSACASTTTQETIPRTISDAVQVTSQPTEDGMADTPIESPDIDRTVEAGVAQTEAPQRPEVKTSLEATDPGSVNLRSGKPTLVEFFAFW